MVDVLRTLDTVVAERERERERALRQEGCGRERESPQTRRRRGQRTIWIMVGGDPEEIERMSDNL